MNRAIKTEIFFIYLPNLFHIDKPVPIILNEDVNGARKRLTGNPVKIGSGPAAVTLPLLGKMLPAKCATETINRFGKAAGSRGEPEDLP